MDKSTYAVILPPFSFPDITLYSPDRMTAPEDGGLYVANDLDGGNDDCVSLYTLKAPVGRKAAFGDGVFESMAVG